jgi:hypothetical protein
MTALHLASRKSYMRVVSSSKIRTRFDCVVCERRGGVDAPADDAYDEPVCGDHAIRDVRVS